MNSWKPKGGRSPARKPRLETLLAMTWMSLRPSGSGWRMGRQRTGRQRRLLSLGGSHRPRRGPGVRTNAGPM